MRILALAPIVALGLIVSFAFGGCRPHRRGRGWNTDKAVSFASRKLDLNSEQEAELHSVLDEVKEAVGDHKDNWMGSRQEVERMILRDTLTAQDITDMMARHEGDRAEARTLFAEKAAEVHAILNPEQRQKVVELMDRRWGRHGRRHR